MLSNLKTEAPVIELKSLETVWIQVAGTKCNLACSHCFLSCHPQNEEHSMMGVQEVNRIVEQSMALGVKEFYFTGGEPFLHPNIKDLIQSVVARRPLTILTNGTLLTDELIHWLSQLKSRGNNSLELRISLEGYTEQENDEIRGEGHYAKILSVCQKLQEHGISPIITLSRVKPLLDCPTMQIDFLKKLEKQGLSNLRLKLLGPLRMGREKRRSREYTGEERLCSTSICSLKLNGLQCGNCRAVTSNGVYCCPILINESDYRLGSTLAESLVPVALEHPACYSCYHHDMTCSN